MLGIHDFWAFLVASFLLWITPGSDTFYILARSISQGRSAGVVSCLGISCGAILHTIVAAFGLSAILATSALAFAGVKVAGASYLICLGINAIRRPTLAASQDSLLPKMNERQIFWQGFVTNVLNPKVAIFFLAFLPQFVDAGAGMGAIPFLVLGGVFVTGGTGYCLVVALFAATASRYIRNNQSTITWLERIAGGVYISLGIQLLRQKLHPA